eukprot:scaffold93329_cov20-Prasinocladus_malaysianus.AAC.1
MSILPSKEHSRTRSMLAYPVGEEHRRCVSARHDWELAQVLHDARAAMEVDQPDVPDVVQVEPVQSKQHVALRERHLGQDVHLRPHHKAKATGCA